MTILEQVEKKIIEISQGNIVTLRKALDDLDPRLTNMSLPDIIQYFYRYPIGDKFDSWVGSKAFADSALLSEYPRSSIQGIIVNIIGHYKTGSMLVAFDCPNSHNYGIGEPFLVKEEGNHSSFENGILWDGGRGNNIRVTSIAPVMRNVEVAAHHLAQSLSEESIWSLFRIKDTRSLNERF